MINYKKVIQLDFRSISVIGELISQATGRPIGIPKPPPETARRDASNGMWCLFSFCLSKKLFFITFFWGVKQKGTSKNQIRGEILIM